MSFVNMGFGNIINSDKIVAVISPDSAPSKRLLQSAKEGGKVIDATQGRRTRALIVTDSGFLVLSALQPETIAGRIKNLYDSENETVSEANSEKSINYEGDQNE